jgi:hypothetical protein
VQLAVVSAPFRVNGHALIATLVHPFDVVANWRVLELAGFTTATDAVPGTATSPARIIAVRRVEATNDVLREDPFHVTVDDGENPLPSTVSAKPVDPATMLLGESPDRLD